MVVLDYLFYRFYLLNRKTTMADIAEYGAIVNVAVIIFTNLIIISINFGVNLLQIASARMFSFIFCGGFMIILYFVYVKSKRYTRIIEKYKNETQWGKFIGNVIIVTYIILSIFCLLVF